VAAPAAAGGGVLIVSSWGQLAGATVLSCLLEATTTQLDNIFMPLHHFALLCLLPL
jgi:dolichol kinase